MSEKVIIIGSGPAGYTAAIYAARADLAPVLFAGPEMGGQLTTTTEVENFPGFPQGILGPELTEQFKKQAERFGTKLISESVTAVDFTKHPFIITTGGKTYETETVIIATGATARRLGLPSEKALYGKGVSACATCDAYFFKDKNVVVIGGGDAAMEEANFLTKFAKQVTIIHRRDEFKASKIMLLRAKNNPKISFIINTEVEEILGVEAGRVTGVRFHNLKTDERKEFICDGVFAAIGHEPSTSLFKNQLELDVKGYIVTHNGTTITSVPGVFAAGDVADYRYRQAITAAASGCQAALDAEKFLENSQQTQSADLTKF